MAKGADIELANLGQLSLSNLAIRFAISPSIRWVLFRRPGSSAKQMAHTSVPASSSITKLSAR